MKKGYTLISVLAVLTLLTASIYTTFMSVSLETQIVKNKRLSDRARMNAQSGLSHFISQGFHYEDIMRIDSPGSRKLVVSEKLTARDKYEVFVSLLSQDKFEVLCKGSVLKRGRVQSSALVFAVFQSTWVSVGR